MSVGGDDYCAMCPKKATARCSGCHGPLLCSRECQKVYWPIHKVNCRASTAALVIPPLAQDEAASLLFVENEAYGLTEAPTHPDILAYLREVGLYGGSMKDLITFLSQEAPHSRRRSTLLVLVRNHLYDCYARPHLQDHPTSPAFTAWHGISPAASALIAPSLTGDSAFTKDGEPLELARPFLEQLLVAYTLLYDHSGGKARLPLIKLGYDRALEVIKRAPVRRREMEGLLTLVGTMAGDLRMIEAQGW